jgi:pimeloyl-ACP methyl ester carboxylesterase
MSLRVESRRSTAAFTDPTDPIRRGVALLRSGLRLSYAERGPVSGTALVLLHGLSDSWRSYQPLLERLPRSLRAIAVSQRGHGDSDRPEQGYLLADFARDLRELLDELSIEQALLVGHSLGASVALRFGRDYPERSLGLALLGAFASFGDNPGVLELQAQIAQLSDPLDVGFLRDFQLATLARPIPADTLEQLVQESQALPRHAWQAILAGLLGPDGQVPLSQIRVPTLLLWGERDAFVPRADQERLLAGLPSARLVTYAGAGHSFHWEDPDESARELAAFAAQLLQPTSAAPEGCHV